MGRRSWDGSILGIIERDIRTIQHISDTANCTYLRRKYGRRLEDSNEEIPKTFNVLCAACGLLDALFSDLSFVSLPDTLLLLNTALLLE